MPTKSRIRTPIGLVTAPRPGTWPRDAAEARELATRLNAEVKEEQCKAENEHKEFVKEIVRLSQGARPKTTARLNPSAIYAQRAKRTEGGRR